MDRGACPVLNQPLRNRNRARPVSRPQSTPAPYGGWNARDSVADMPESDAVILDNWFPSESRISLRKGFAEHATGLPGHVETLMSYNPDGANLEMWAVSDGSIYETTASGDVGAAAVTGLSNSRWQYANFGTSGGQFIVAVNGEDDLLLYDGASWEPINSGSTPAITGVDTANLINLCTFKRRLFFVQRNTLSFWFLPVDSIGGAASEFDLAPLCRRGGELIACETWTRDGGDGLSDLAVFYTSEGEVLIYQGINPASASEWSLVGVFQIGRPIGYRCLSRLGTELFVMSEDGFQPISRALQSARTNRRAVLSDKIRTAVRSSVEAARNNFGWEMCVYPKGGWVVFNIPLQENQLSHQYVANTTTGAWCRFIGMNANTWLNFNGDLFFGGDGVVYQADTGTTDNGANIETDVLQAYTYLGSPGWTKDFAMIRPILTVDGDVQVALTVNINFEEMAPRSTPDFAIDGEAVWDVAEWNETFWTVGPSLTAQWVSVGRKGFAGGVRMKTATQNINMSWSATQWIAQRGQGML